MEITKRDGSRQEFDRNKIVNAVLKAMKEDDNEDYELAHDIAWEIERMIKNGKITNVEEIQDQVEIALMNTIPTTAKLYILYREKRAKLREQGWEMTDLQRDIYEQKYRDKDETFCEFVDRIADGNSFIAKAIRDKEFLPAGRILAGRGVDTKATLSNCYVMPKPKDNLESIYDTNKYLARTYSRGGGCGVDISGLRPKDSKVNNSAETSTGAVSFMELYNQTTELISQKKRRGALMISMEVNHPDILDFINIKTDTDKITSANISVVVNDEFMKAVKNDEAYELSFYIPENEESISKIVNARDVFKKLAYNNWNYAEPGMLFKDRIDDYNIMSADPNFEYAGVNPCQPKGEYILTRDGFRKIEDIENNVVLGGKEYSTKGMFPTGNKEVFEVTLENNAKIRMTGNHLVTDSQDEDKPLSEYSVGDKVRVDYTPIYDIEIDNQEDYELGFNKGNRMIMDVNYKSKSFKIGYLKSILKLNTTDDKNVLATLNSTNEEWLLGIQRTLIEFGIYSEVYEYKKGYWELKSYSETSRKRTLEIKNIKSLGNMDVYDITVDSVHHYNTNGLVVHNCAEEPLPAFGSCNLSSINLGSFVRNPFTNEARFDYDSFAKMVRNGVIYLNEILDENMSKHPLPQQTKVSQDLKQIGLGLMGLADMFIKLGIRYGSKESLDLIGKIGHLMINEALKQSSMLAKEQGTFPLYSKDHVLESEFLKENADEDTMKMIEKYGLRNSQLLTIAPTGSIATLIGVSNGVEPLFQISYTRKTESLFGQDTFYTVYSDIVKEYAEVNGLDINDPDLELPDFIVTAGELNYKERIDVQSACQKFVDASISSTVNLPNEATVEEVEELYMYAWEKGLKGITIYRDGCAREGILTTSDTTDSKSVETNSKANDTCPSCGGKLIHSGGCNECQDCGFSMCSI